MIRQTVFDRLRWWATLLEGRSIADRQHGWSGLWLSSEDAATVVRLMREAAAQGEVTLDRSATQAGSCGNDHQDDEWPDTQPASFDAPTWPAVPGEFRGQPQRGGSESLARPRLATANVATVSRRLLGPLRMR